MLNNQYPVSAGSTNVTDLSMTHTPEAFRPPVLNAAVQNKYLLIESLRQFFTPSPQPRGLLAYGYLEYGVTTGDIDWLGEYDNLPIVDEKYTPKMVGVRKYGAKVQWSRDEQETDRYSLIGQRQDSAMNLLRMRENATAIAAMITGLNHGKYANDELLSDWTDTSIGTPAEDVKLASTTILLNTKKQYEGDTLLMNTRTELLLYYYDWVKNSLYTQAQFIETGKMSRLAGYPIVNIEELPDGYIFLFNSGIIGEWMTTMPLRSDIWQLNPQLYEQWIMTAGEPVVTHPAVQFRGKVAEMDSMEELLRRNKSKDKFKPKKVA